ncbi:hypothetical protein Tco_0723793 [Tanacetum coccineum]
MSKLLYTCFIKLIINHFLSTNKSTPRRSSSKFHSSQDDQPITKLSNTVKGDYKFGMEIPDTMIIDVIKKLAGYKFYMAKKVESENVKNFNEPEEQHVSLVKSGRGKGFMYDHVVNVPNKLKKDDVPRKIRSLTIIKETVVDIVVDTYAEWGQKFKSPAVDDPAVQFLLDLRKGSKASRLESLKQKKQAVVREGSSVAHNKYYDSSDIDSDATLYSLSSEKPEESANETDDADESDIEYFIQTLLDETPANELTDFISHLVYPDAQTTSVVHNLEGNLKLTSYVSGASEVPLETHVDVLETKTLLQEMFLDENAHNLSSPPSTKTSYPTTYPQPSSLQAKEKKLMQKEKNNMRKINFKKAVTQKFGEYDGSSHKFQYHDALNAQDAEPSFHKRSYDNQDPPNNREGENRRNVERIWCKETHRYIFKAINGIHHWEDSRIDFFKAEMSTRTEGSVYSDLRIISIVHVVDFNNALLLFIRRVVIQNRVEDIQLELSEVKKFCDGTLEKIRENLIDMVKIKNKLCIGNKRLKGRDWTDMDVKKSNKIIDKIDKVLKHRDQLKRLKAYCGISYIIIRGRFLDLASF